MGYHVHVSPTNCGIRDISHITTTIKKIVMEITRVSQLTGIKRTRELNITPEQLKSWENGEHAQNAFPHLSPDEREFIISGCTQEEWDQAFKHED